MIIAIDGPAGAGKTSTAKKTAKELGFLYVDTGAMYRAIAWYMLKHDMPAEEAISQIQMEIITDKDDGEQKIMVDGEDISTQIRTPDIAMIASTCSAIPAVRAFLLHKQQAMALNGSIVMEGRDIGSVVFPDAELKVYLTADLEKRALRRKEDLEEKLKSLDPATSTRRGIKWSLQEIREDIQMRDLQDMTREEAPLVQGSDAVLIDNSNMTLRETVEAIKAIAICRMDEWDRADFKEFIKRTVFADWLNDIEL